MLLLLPLLPGAWPSRACASPLKCCVHAGTALVSPHSTPLAMPRCTSAKHTRGTFTHGCRFEAPRARARQARSHGDIKQWRVEQDTNELPLSCARQTAVQPKTTHHQTTATGLNSVEQEQPKLNQKHRHVRRGRRGHRAACQGMQLSAKRLLSFACGLTGLTVTSKTRGHHLPVTNSRRRSASHAIPAGKGRGVSEEEGRRALSERRPRRARLGHGPAPGVASSYNSRHVSVVKQTSLPLPQTLTP